MKIYDTHSDILFNLYQRHMDGEQKIFERYHLNNLKKGGVVGGIWVVYSETDFDVFNAYKIALEEFALGIILVSIRPSSDIKIF